MSPRTMGRELIRTAWLGALIVMIPDSARADATALVGLMSVGGPAGTCGCRMQGESCPRGTHDRRTSTGVLIGQPKAKVILAHWRPHLPKSLEKPATSAPEYKE